MLAAPRKEKFHSHLDFRSQRHRSSLPTAATSTQLPKRRNAVPCPLRRYTKMTQLLLLHPPGGSGGTGPAPCPPPQIQHLTFVCSSSSSPLLPGGGGTGPATYPPPRIQHLAILQGRSSSSSRLQPAAWFVAGGGYRTEAEDWATARWGFWAAGRKDWSGGAEGILGASLAVRRRV